MKIDINKIDEGRFVIREENNKEYLDQLAASLKMDGQWNPIIVRPKEDGRYEVIAGHYRLQAARKAGFKEIEATVRDLPNDEATILSLKTNLLRMEMTAREQGQVLSNILEEFGWSQKKLSEHLGVSPDWISRRIRVALDLHDLVVKALESNKITFDIASIIGGVEISRQPDFLQLILERGTNQSPEARRMRRQFQNDIIFTIGYQGHTATTFVNILKENDIESVMDVRFSSDSQYKPEFNGPILKRELERNNIKYFHKPEFGLPYLIQNPYKDGDLGYNCVKQWYKWHVNKETNFDSFIADLKKIGKTALMCMEQFSKPKGEQKYACHRDILADIVLEYKTEDKLLLYIKRKDL